MNILLRATISEMNSKAIEAFFKNNYSENNVLVYDIQDFSKIEFTLSKNNLYDTRMMSKHDYRHYPDYMKARPIDKRIMDLMSPYESMSYKMMDLYFPEIQDYSQRRKIFLEATRLLNHIIEKHSINLFITLGAPHQVYDYLLYVLCKIKNIPTFIAYRLPVRGYLFFYNDIEDQCKFFSKKSFIKESELSKPFLDLYLKYSHADSYIKPYYMKLSKWERVKKFLGQLKTFTRYSFNPKTVMEIINLVNKKRIKDNFIKRVSGGFCIEKKYIYVALHYQPEATTVPLGDIFSDQYLIVEMLSFCVPDDVYICVKEHPSQGIRGGRYVDFFKSIIELRNVVIAPTFYDSGKLLNNALAIATCTGTIALEAMFKNKPVFLFGKYVYNSLPNAFSIETIEDCKNAITKINSKYDVTEQEKLNYIGMLDSFKYHADYVIEEKEYMLSQGVSIKENNDNLYKMLSDMVAFLG